MREVTAGKGHTVAGIDAARDWLAARADGTGRIAVIGFCLGGSYALALAAGHGYGRAGGLDSGPMADAPGTIGPGAPWPAAGA